MSVEMAPLPPPAASRHPSRYTLRRARASPVINGSDHNIFFFADVILPPAEQDLTRSFTPTCPQPARREARAVTRGRGASLRALKTAASDES